MTNSNIKTWLFNPFYYIAGAQALAIGLILILAAGAIGAVSKTHFDGVLDTHTGLDVPFWKFLSEGFIDWIIMAILLQIGGWIISKNKTGIRIIDVFGTQALARGPSLIIALIALLPGYRRYGQHLADQLFKRSVPTVSLQSADPIVFGIVLVITILVTIWMIVLMYKAFEVSCNVKGGAAIGVFIAALLVGEFLSKILIIKLVTS